MVPVIDFTPLPLIRKKKLVMGASAERCTKALRRIIPEGPSQNLNCFENEDFTGAFTNRSGRAVPKPGYGDGVKADEKIQFLEREGGSGRLVQDYRGGQSLQSNRASL